ncbi:MAG: imidazole glycerol phosphate synthase subunit HisH [Gammaproteobacteria bacterium]|nr:imidazole glycerol phosphate synthase subunit HisH [Gammaproteobacteria bacterium]NNC77046.1 imidazole glycerol phosphate synthase subunit HisH [Woeseiaceae bacterium]
MATDIAIVDSGGANIASLLYAFERLGKQVTLTHDSRTIEAAKYVVLPGVGAARDAMQRLKEFDLVNVIRSLTQPVLGICLGMQLLAEASEEDDVECLGIVPGVATRLPVDSGNPVPNMGWCELMQGEKHSLFEGIQDREYFYFLHSFVLPVSNVTLASASHATPFSAAIRKDNFLAVQFHPERSSQAGARLLANFLEVDI